MGEALLGIAASEARREGGNTSLKFGGELSSPFFSGVTERGGVEAAGFLLRRRSGTYLRMVSR